MSGRRSGLLMLLCLALGCQSSGGVGDAGGKTISDLGVFSEGYRPIEGGLFRSAQRTVLTSQNASSETRSYDPTEAGKRPPPARIERVTMTDITSTARLPAEIATLDAAQPLLLPPLSVARIVCE